MARNISIYRNLREINSERFHEIKFTGNIFLVNKNHEDEIEYDQEEIFRINEGWLKLYDEYFEKTDDPRFRKELKNKDKTLYLLLVIKKIEDVLKLMKFAYDNREYIPGDAYLNAISGMGNSLKKLDRHIKFDSTQELPPQIKKVESVLGGLKSRYEILFKEDLQVEERDIMLYYDIKAHIESAIGRNLPEIINMLQWIAYEKQYKTRIRNEQHSREGRSKGNSRNMG